MRVINKFLIAALLAAAAMCCATGAGAAQKGFYLMGDVTDDDILSISDATKIQYALAGLTRFSPLSSYLADVDGNKSADINDVTEIQRRLSNLPDSFHSERLVAWQADITGVSGNTFTAAAGAQARFTVNSTQHEIQTEYEIYSNGSVVRERSANPDFTLGFDSPGQYEIVTVAYDPFGGTAKNTFSFTVTNEKPVVEKVEISKSSFEVNVTASGGEAPYEYLYEISLYIPPEPTTEPDLEYPATDCPTKPEVAWLWKSNQNGMFTLSSDYINKNPLIIPSEYISAKTAYTLTVTVRDSRGETSDSYSIDFEPYSKSKKK